MDDLGTVRQLLLWRLAVVASPAVPDATLKNSAGTMIASISGLKLLLDECADLRSELVVIHTLTNDGDADGAFSARQQGRIVELRDAAQAMKALVIALPHGAHGSDEN